MEAVTSKSWFVSFHEDVLIWKQGLCLKLHFCSKLSELTKGAVKDDFKCEEDGAPGSSVKRSSEVPPQRLI